MFYLCLLNKNLISKFKSKASGGTKNFKNVEAHTINLDELFLAFNASLSKFDSEHGMANSRARLRMTTLYQVAAANKGIVVELVTKLRILVLDFIRSMEMVE